METKQNIIFALFGLLIGVYAGFALVGFFLLPRTETGAIEFRVINQQTSVNSILASFFIIGGSGICGALSAYVFRMRKILNEQKRRLLEAQEVNKTKDEFISMILHHLRTPLSGIRWSIKEILKEMDLTHPLRKSLELLNGANMRALTAVEHLLETSQASLGRIQYSFEIFPMDKFLETLKKSVEVMKARAKEKGLTMNVEFHSPSKSFIRADIAKVINVVHTLIENAIQYTQAPGVITIRSEERDFNFFFHVADTGIGIPPEEQPRIFLQFFRGVEARKVEPGGFGIGLYLAKVFIENQKGEISFVSQVGKGTTFSFRLPLIVNPTEKFLEQIE